MKKTKFKELIKKFKEIWDVPRYKAIIKLSLYGIMFLLLIIMANIYSESKSNNSEQTNNKLSLAEIIQSTDYENIDIKYNIKDKNNEYTIEGKIKENNLNGYIEYNGTIKKIVLKENNIYNINNNIETVDEELNNLFNKNFLIPKNIIEITSNESSYIEKLENKTIYTYIINEEGMNIEIKLITDLEHITSIKIKNEIIEYNLELIFDKEE